MREFDQNLFSRLWLAFSDGWWAAKAAIGNSRYPKSDLHNSNSSTMNVPRVTGH